MDDCWNQHMRVWYKFLIVHQVDWFLQNKRNLEFRYVLCGRTILVLDEVKKIDFLPMQFWF
ncbi:hypothetical protein FQR65_LT12947 [Abscondita terminalis]|nr:hypothetical protein FQR65_LT12947 [Abscondita terminalis]